MHLVWINALFIVLTHVFAIIWGRLLSPAYVLREHPWSHIRSFEAEGRLYARWCRVRAWKHLLPDGGAWLGHFRKASLDTVDRAYLAQFIGETRRGEFTHMLGFIFFFPNVLWNDVVVSGMLLLYGVVAHVPCIVVQRYNRARLLRVWNRQRPDERIGTPKIR
jgi:glycosyl-4,4'-diaponeurosporenoate acyltransferase